MLPCMYVVYKLPISIPVIVQFIIYCVKAVIGAFTIIFPEYKTQSGVQFGRQSMHIHTSSLSF